MHLQTATFCLNLDAKGLNIFGIVYVDEQSVKDTLTTMDAYYGPKRNP